jgi:hypothetical protein
VPSLTTLERIERTEQRISELAAGKEVDAKHITVLLSKERQREFAAEWRRQQKLRLVKKPVALNEYETLHKQAAAVLARCIASATRTKAEQATLFKLQSKCVTAIERAQAEIAKQTKKRAALTEWLDRAVAVTLPVIELDNTNQKAIKHNNAQLNDSYERLPILVTSKNDGRRVTQEERFGWLTKRDIRLRLLRDTLNELIENLDAELEREQNQREVRAARVFMDGFVTARKSDKNAWAEANAALQRNGFRRLDVQYSRGSDVRDHDVREMEAALMKQIEAAMTADEREQQVMSKEFDLQAAKRGK